MDGFINFVRSQMMRRFWFAVVMIVGGLAFILSGDFTWPNAIFCLIVLIFLGIGWAVIFQVRRAMTPTQERKEP